MPVLSWGCLWGSPSNYTPDPENCLDPNSSTISSRWKDWFGGVLGDSSESIFLTCMAGTGFETLEKSPQPHIDTPSKIYLIPMHNHHLPTNSSMRCSTAAEQIVAVCSAMKHPHWLLPAWFFKARVIAISILMCSTSRISTDGGSNCLFCWIFCFPTACTPEWSCLGSTNEASNVDYVGVGEEEKVYI